MCSVQYVVCVCVCVWNLCDTSLQRGIQLFFFLWNAKNFPFFSQGFFWQCKSTIKTKQKTCGIFEKWRTARCRTIRQQYYIGPYTKTKIIIEKHLTGTTQFTTFKKFINLVVVYKTNAYDDGRRIRIYKRCPPKCRHQPEGTGAS